MTVNLLRRWAGVPVYESAQILSGSKADRVELLLTSTTRDLDRDCRCPRLTYKSFRTSGNGQLNDEVQWSYEQKDEIVMSAAHDHLNGQRVMFRSCKDEKNAAKKRLFVERWSNTSLLQSIEVTDCHGDFNADNMFGRISFHPTRHSLLAYVAERKKAEDKSYKRFEYIDNWGETLAEKTNPSVVVLDFDGGLPEQKAAEGVSKTGESEAASEVDDKPSTKGKVIVMKSPEDYTCADVVFAPEEGQVVFVATNTFPRRYGILACPTRRSCLMQANYDGSESRNLTESLGHVRSPHAAHNGQIYFLSNAVGGPHRPCSSIHRYDKSTGKSEIVFDIVHENTPEKIGIYCVGMASIDGKWLVMNTSHRSTVRALVLKIEANGTLSEPNESVNGTDSDISWSAIGFGKGQVIVSRHNPDGEAELRHFNLLTNTVTTILNSPSPVSQTLTHRIIHYPNHPYLQSILLLPSDNEKALIRRSNNNLPPAIIFAHGGPHGAYETKFSAQMAAYVDAGIAILQVNYTGSVGQGQSSIDALVGRIGDLEISDVHLARDQLAESGLVDASRIAVMGGSHGGFVAGMLLGRYPDAYKCGVLLNPVTNLGTIGAGSDIPEWAQAEMGYEYDLARPPLLTPDRYEKLWRGSPMSVVENVKVPVLMVLGGKDRRVPNYEGRNWVAHLRGKGHGEVRCLMFPEDGHSLDSGDAFKAVFEGVLDFFKDHL